MSRSVFMHRRGIALLSQDDFNRANAAIGSTSGPGLLDPQAWTVSLGSMNVASNHAAGGTPATTNQAWVELGTPDQDVTYTIGGTVDASHSVQVICRLSDSSHYLYSHLGGIWQDNGGASTLATGSGAGSGDTVRMVCKGNTITVYVNGVFSCSTTTSFNNTATKAGFQMFQTPGATVDNWMAYQA